ncbi:hypothetical protein D3C71_1420190 [compost metagenome]
MRVLSGPQACASTSQRDSCRGPLEKTNVAVTRIHELVGKVQDYLSGGESFALLEYHIHRQKDGSYKEHARDYLAF